jgi:hypothetical protein
MARQDRNNTAAYRIIAVCFVLTLAYSMFIIAVFLRAKAAVCSTTSAGINLSIAFVSQAANLCDGSSAG